MIVPQIAGAQAADLEAIRRIYNEGIEDRLATVDADPKTTADIATWFGHHQGRYAVLVARGADGGIIGWSSLNPYAYRCAYDGVADLSIYVARVARGIGVGSALMRAIETCAKSNGFHKIVLFTLAKNAAARALYDAFAYREVGVFRDHGQLDGALVDVTAMEKLFHDPATEGMRAAG